jgi:hypothetical protein
MGKLNEMSSVVETLAFMVLDAIFIENVVVIIVAIVDACKRGEV